MKKYTVLLALALLVGAQRSCTAAAGTARLLWAGTAAGTLLTFGPTVKTLLESYVPQPQTATEQAMELTKAILELRAQPVAAPLTAEQLESIVNSAVTKAVGSNSTAQPAEFGWRFVGSLFAFITEHKALSFAVGTVGIGAVVCASHEGTRALVRERITALGTALERLKAQLMARMNGIEQQITDNTNQLGQAINEVDQHAAERLTAFAAANHTNLTAIAARLSAMSPDQPAIELQPAPTFEAQPLFTPATQPVYEADTVPLVPAEQLGLFGRMCSWFGNLNK
jgi:hypothetical protein